MENKYTAATLHTAGEYVTDKSEAESSLASTLGGFVSSLRSV